MEITVRGMLLGEKDGKILIDLECRTLERNEYEVLEGLFPNTFRGVEELLAKEALLASVEPGDKTGMDEYQKDEAIKNSHKKKMSKPSYHNDNI